MPSAMKWVKQQHFLIRLLDSLLRGMGEIIFMNNSITGLIILIAVFIQSWQFAVCMIIGSITSSLTAIVFKLNSTSIANGIYGYNAVLLQTGIAEYHSFDQFSFVEIPYIIGPIIMMSVLSTIMIAGLGAIFIKHFKLSPLELPSMMCTWIWILGASGSFSYFAVNGTKLQPSLKLNPVNYEVQTQQPFEIKELI